MNYTNYPDELYHWKYIDKIKLPSGKWEYIYSRAGSALNGAGKRVGKVANRAGKGINKFAKKSAKSISKYAGKGKNWTINKLQKADRVLGNTLRSNYKDVTNSYGEKFRVGQDRGISGKLYGKRTSTKYANSRTFKREIAEKKLKEFHNHERLAQVNGTHADARNPKAAQAPRAQKANNIINRQAKEAKRQMRSTLGESAKASLQIRARQAAKNIKRENAARKAEERAKAISTADDSGLKRYDPLKSHDVSKKTRKAAEKAIKADVKKANKQRALTARRENEAVYKIQSRQNARNLRKAEAEAADRKAKEAAAKQARKAAEKAIKKDADRAYKQRTEALARENKASEYIRQRDAYRKKNKR